MKIKMGQKAIILINLGTPDTPEVKSVRRYLFQFLNDSRVIDLPLLLRKFLVNFIIVPFRAKKSSKLYKLLWTENGSPLLFYTKRVWQKLQKLLGNDYKVLYAMRYGNPSLKTLLKEIESENFSDIIFVPLYPQYSSSTTGSVYELILKEIGKWHIIPNLKFVNQFYNNKVFIKAFKNEIIKNDINKYEHIIFSFHGLPLNQIQNSHPNHLIVQCDCKASVPLHGNYCYKATCYETARLMAEVLNLSENQFSISFQSRLSENWLSPFTDKLLIEKAKSGIKNILIVAPSFVSDCLETIVEIEIEYRNLFIENGGNNLTLVKGLNDSDEWVEALKEIIMS